MSLYLFIWGPPVLRLTRQRHENRLYVLLANTEKSTIQKSDEMGKKLYLCKEECCILYIFRMDDSHILKMIGLVLVCYKVVTIANLHLLPYWKFAINLNSDVIRKTNYNKSKINDMWN